jgi:hypothetical protein
VLLFHLWIVYSPWNWADFRSVIMSHLLAAPAENPCQVIDEYLIIGHVEQTSTFEKKGKGATRHTTTTLPQGYRLAATCVGKNSGKELRLSIQAFPNGSTASSKDKLEISWDQATDHLVSHFIQRMQHKGNLKDYIKLLWMTFVNITLKPGSKVILACSKYIPSYLAKHSHANTTTFDHTNDSTIVASNHSAESTSQFAIGGGALLANSSDPTRLARTASIDHDAPIATSYRKLDDEIKDRLLRAFETPGAVLKEDEYPSLLQALRGHPSVRGDVGKGLDTRMLRRIKRDSDRNNSHPLDTAEWMRYESIHYNMEWEAGTELPLFGPSRELQELVKSADAELFREFTGSSYLNLF